MHQRPPRSLHRKNLVTIAQYAADLAQQFINPDSTYWSDLRKKYGKTKEGWAKQYRYSERCHAFPYPKTLWDINCGHCETFCDLLTQKFPGGEEIWLDDLFLNDPSTQPKGFSKWSKEKQDKWVQEVETPSHCVYLYQGKFHDAQNPEGVETWTDLEVMRNRNKTRDQWLWETRTQAFEKAVLAALPSGGAAQFEIYTDQELELSDIKAEAPGNGWNRRTRRHHPARRPTPDPAHGHPGRKPPIR